MESRQAFLNQSSIKTEIQQQRTNSSNSRLLITMIISVLLTAIITGAVIYFWLESTNKRAINDLEQKIAFLEKQISTMKKIETTPQPTLWPISPTLVDRPVNGWRVYRNDEFNFQFSYPSEWDFKLGTGQLFLFRAFLTKEDRSQQPVEIPGDIAITPYYQISIIVEDNPKNLSAKDFYLKDFAPEVRDEIGEKLEKVNIAGEDAIKYQQGAAPSSGLVTTVLISHKGKVYQLDYGAMAYKETHEKYMSVFNQILSSFQFLK